MFQIMKRAFLFALALLCASIMAPFAAAQTQRPAQPEPRVLVELYTAQGCSACPNANRLLGEIVREPEVLALTFPVGYWDYLGWTDTMARPEFSDRQRDYMRALAFRGLSTPQFVFNGAAQVRGGRTAPVRSMLQTTLQTATLSGPPINVSRVHDTRADIEIGTGRAPPAPADVWLVIYEAGPLLVRIRGGENAGRVITHYNVVRRVAKLGAWNGAALRFGQQRCWPRCAILIQAPEGGAILSFGDLR